MRHAYSQVQHRNRRILRYLQHRPAAPAEISEALDIPLGSLYRRLKKLRRERAILAEYGFVYITGRGREMARDGYVPRPRRERRGTSQGRSEAPDRRVRSPSRRQIDAFVQALAAAQAPPRQVQAPTPPVAPLLLPPALPPLPPAERPRPTGAQHPSELGGVPVGSGLWLMPDGSYVLRLA
jgi:hypothetical protein